MEVLRSDQENHFSISRYSPLANKPLPNSDAQRIAECNNLSSNDRQQRDNLRKIKNIYALAPEDGDDLRVVEFVVNGHLAALRSRWNQIHCDLVGRAPSQPPVHAQPPVSETLKDAYSSLVSGDCAAAASRYRPLAERGNAEAQYYLGYMYQGGYGVPIDNAIGLSWIQKAADQGQPDAQTSMALESTGNSQSPGSDAAAAMWHVRAAENGSVSSQMILGFMNETGHGAPQDFEQAHKWLSLAVARMSSSDELIRVHIAKARDNVEKKLTPDQLANAQRQATDWMNKVGSHLPPAAPITMIVFCHTDFFDDQHSWP